MDITIELATVEQKEVVANLMEKYEYEFSQYNDAGVDELGLFGCMEWIDCYWEEADCWAYLIKVDNRLAGFAFVGDFEIEGQRTDFMIDEFFVMYKYRNLGVGKFVVNNLLERHQGKWGLCYTPRNLPATKFWPKVIGAYTNGNYERIENYESVVYDDGTLGTVLLFDSRLSDAIKEG